jgi:hypothetical protein
MFFDFFSLTDHIDRAPRAARTRSLNFLKYLITHLFTEIAAASNDIILMSGQWHSTKL